MQVNHFFLISHLIFSPVSSWTRLGSSQTDSIISDYYYKLMLQTAKGSVDFQFDCPLQVTLLPFSAGAKNGWMDGGIFEWSPAAQTPRGLCGCVASQLLTKTLKTP